ncbi:MAG: thioredoxin-dependent thiol peroxidase [Bacteroidetes bacterium]|nr:MAG: thioredoxin-dependent thiol peroxidase [Bacteroidota bacterium]
MIQKGEMAPSFISVDQQGKEFDSGQLKGKKWVLYFYPKDMTPGCTTQACNIRDHHQELQSKGITVVGVSMDSVKRHQRFTNKYELPFTLLADEERKVIDLFGVWGEKKFMGRVFDGILRTTFVIDEKGEVLEVITRPKTKAHAEEIFAIYQEKEERK